MLRTPWAAKPLDRPDRPGRRPAPPYTTHLDLYTARPDAEIRRLQQLGAALVQWLHYPSPDPNFAVLADPDDNIFCVIDKSAKAD